MCIETQVFLQHYFTGWLVSNWISTRHCGGGFLEDKLHRIWFFLFPSFQYQSLCDCAYFKASPTEIASSMTSWSHSTHKSQITICLYRLNLRKRRYIQIFLHNGVSNTIIECHMITPRSWLSSFGFLTSPNLLIEIKHHGVIQSATGYSSKQHQQIMRLRHICQRSSLPGSWIGKPLSWFLLLPFELFHFYFIFVMFSDIRALEDRISQLERILGIP